MDRSIGIYRGVRKVAYQTLSREQLAGGLGKQGEKRRAARSRRTGGDAEIFKRSRLEAKARGRLLIRVSVYLR